MERVCQFFVGLAVFIAVIMVPAHAGTILFDASQFKAIEEDERFPESKFGAEPAPVVVEALPTGWGSNSIEDEGISPGRSIASTGGNKGFGLTTAAENGDGAEQKAVPKVAEVSNELKSRKGVQEIGLIAGDLGFFPKTIFVNRDVPVRMYVTGASKASLCIMMDSFQVKKQIKPNKIEEITFTPANAGKFRFYCPVNGMEGTMIVREVASNIE